MDSKRLINQKTLDLATPPSNTLVQEETSDPRDTFQMRQL